MSIYRGAGGSGDAVNDASSEATLVAQLATEAQTSATNAASSATSAAGSASNAANSANSASTSASNAATSATNASNSASAASTSATNAANSATAAQTAKTAAELAETNAETAQSAAASSASAASTSASNAATSATNASNSASAAATSATNASNSATSASTSATNAASSASSASTSATNAAASASAAGTSATAAAGSATSAAGSATTATTQAGIATTQATNAASSASAAATSATNASNSASAASTSATNASNSANSAATSATNAAASYDSFDDRYLGAKSVAPTLDNDGNTLLVGALYFNTVSNFMKVWDGSSWLDAYASLSGALLSANNLSDLTNTATARTNLGLAIGTNVQAYDAQLADVAGLTPSDNNFIVGNGTNFVTESGATARTSLGGTTVGQNLFTLTNPTAVTFPRFNADNTVSTLDAATFRTAIGAGTGNGTVTSVTGTTGRTTSSGGTTPAIDLASGIVTAGTTGSSSLIPVITVDTYGRVTSVTTASNPQGTVTSVTGTSPVVSSGGATPAISLAANYGDTQNPYASKTANNFLAAPNGTAGVPSFRAIIAADIPTLNQNTTGTASNVTGTVAIANGGTGATTRQNAMDALAGAVTSGQYLRGNGTDVVMSAIQAADVPTLNQNTTGSAATLTTGRTIAITGDLAYTSGSFNGSANVTGTGTLATVNSNVGSFGSSTAIPVVTVNAKGLVTAVTTATVAGGQYFGTAATKAIAYNSNTIGENVTVTAGNNGLSAGPITISNGFTVTVQTGAAWVIV